MPVPPFRLRVLIIEDDRLMRELLTFWLGNAGYTVTAIDWPSDALRTLQRTRYDLFLVNLILPGMDGVELCHQIRRRCATPIILLSAAPPVICRQAALQADAADYLRKPFHPDDLLMRIAAVLPYSA